MGPWDASLDDAMRPHEPQRRLSFGLKRPHAFVRIHHGTVMAGAASKPHPGGLHPSQGQTERRMCDPPSVFGGGAAADVPAVSFQPIRCVSGIQISSLESRSTPRTGGTRTSNRFEREDLRVCPFRRRRFKAIRRPGRSSPTLPPESPGDPCVLPRNPVQDIDIFSPRGVDSRTHPPAPPARLNSSRKTSTHDARPYHALLQVEGGFRSEGRLDGCSETIQSRDRRRHNQASHGGFSHRHVLSSRSEGRLDAS